MGSVSKQILVVDDDPAIRKMIKIQLEMEGYAVLSAGDTPAAIDAAKNNDILVMLLDLHLSDGDGFQVLQAVKKTKPALPVIMVTGSHDEEEARRALEMGAWDYITKPIDFNYLKNILLMQSPQ